MRLKMVDDCMSAAPSRIGRSLRGGWVMIMTAVLLIGCTQGLINPEPGRLNDALADRHWPDLARDVNLQTEIRRFMADNPGSDPQAELSAHVFKDVVLVVGATADQRGLDAVTAFAASRDGVRRVHDETLTERQRTTSALHDRLLKRRFIGSLLASTRTLPESFNRGRVHAVVDDARLFLMGAVTREEALAIADLARRQHDIKEVILLFDYIQ
jgi:osmotically-inducible protein OsmY